MALSTTSHAVLGLLRLRPWTTYELAKQVQRSLGWFWPRAERKLYEEPKRLAAAGFATATAEMTGARPRTVYDVTPAGRTALGEWLSAPPAPPTLEFEGMVKVFFADGGTVEQLRSTLASIGATADERLAALETMLAEEAAGRVPFPERQRLNGLAMRFQLDFERMTGEWARWALAETAGWSSPTGP